MARLVLKRSADRRVRAGHPWVYRGEIADLAGAWSAAEAVDVVDAGGRFLGRGYYNPRTSLACRIAPRLDEPIDRAFVRRRLEAALEYRRAAGLVGDAYRLCWSEADGLPGLVVDRYGPVSVIQCLTLGMARIAPWIAEALAGMVPGRCGYRMGDATPAPTEGVGPERALVGGAGPPGPIGGGGGRPFIVSRGGRPKN